MITIIKKSFYNWCIENNLNNILELWDYSLNTVSPKEVGYQSNSKFYFKCPKGIHKSEEKYILTIHNSKKVRCKACNSLGQYMVDLYGEDYLKEKWSDKNTVSPFEIFSGSNKKIWLKCTVKDYHPDYEQAASSFVHGYKCPYCTSKKILPQDSWGTHYSKYLDLWSDLNTEDPYSISP
mgnify:CR=1 FL=1